jgi:hypothetical protein
MKSHKNVHVVPHASGWAVVRDGAKRASRVTTTQAAAERFATHFAKTSGVEMLLHGKHGYIRARNSHGNDPFDIKG